MHYFESMAWNTTRNTHLGNYVPPLRGLAVHVYNGPTAPALGYVLSSLAGLTRDLFRQHVIKTPSTGNIEGALVNGGGLGRRNLLRVGI